MHAMHDKTNTGELSLPALQHYIAHAEVADSSPQGVMVHDIELPRWFVYLALFSAAGIVLLLIGLYVWSGADARHYV